MGVVLGTIVSIFSNIEQNLMEESFFVINGLTKKFQLVVFTWLHPVQNCT